jgi:hypothetical protein
LLSHAFDDAELVLEEKEAFRSFNMSLRASAAWPPAAMP